MDVLIETPRCIIREMLPEDAQGLFEMDSDPEVHKYIAQNPLKTMDDVRARIQIIRLQYAENHIARWSVADKRTGEVLGWTGFKLMKEPANGRIGHYDFGYRFKQSAWGKGYATEVGRASLHYGIDILRLDPVYAMTDVDNAASRRVLEKLGFRFVEIFNYEGASNWRTPNNLAATWYEWPGNSTP